MLEQVSKLKERVIEQRSLPKTHVISVSSGKGGVGKTSFAVNFAIALSRLGKRILIIDADFGLANIDVMLGVSVLNDLSSVINGQKELRDIVAQGHQGVKFISGIGGARTDLARRSQGRLPVPADVPAGGHRRHHPAGGRQACPTSCSGWSAPAMKPSSSRPRTDRDHGRLARWIKTVNRFEDSLKLRLIETCHFEQGRYPDARQACPRREEEHATRSEQDGVHPQDPSVAWR